MNEFAKATGEIDKVLSDYEDMMKSVRETLKEKMKGVFKAFFNAHPEVKTVHWTQYTPHFNDGEECLFGVREPYFTTTESRDLEDVYGEDDDGNITEDVWDSVRRKYVENEALSKELLKDMRSLEKILQSDANEDVMRAMFGNHVWVKAHRDGFDVDEYDHD